MFGLIVSGRPVDATPQAVTQTQYAFRVRPSPAFTHIVVFILPGVSLPADTAATVYVQIPPSQDFKLLGGIGPGKESAIFKITGLKDDVDSATTDVDLMTDDATLPTDTTATAGEAIVIGISIESSASVSQQLATLKPNQSTTSSVSNPSTAMIIPPNPNNIIGAADGPSVKLLAQRIIGNAFNFLASFGSDTIPLRAFQDWWTKFEKKVELDPSFLQREQQS